MEPLTQTAVLAIQDRSQVAAARRCAAEFAKAGGFDERREAAVGVVAVELANNLLQHAGGGELFVRVLEAEGALEIAAVDHGAGMASIPRCLEDGFSTASTPGLGLGAVSRLCDRFAAFSVPGRTTVVAGRLERRAPRTDYSVVCRPIPGETLSGDCWAVSDDGSALLVVDGLGHGLLAAEAARAAVEIFRKHQESSPQRILESMHAALRPTRGAAAAIARIDAAAKTLLFAGIGNIACSVWRGGRSQSLVSHNGTLGHQMRRVQEFPYSYEAGDVLLMQSDGLATQSKLGIPPLLPAQPPFLIAPFLFSELVRGRDDATILVRRLE